MGVCSMQSNTYILYESEEEAILTSFVQTSLTVKFDARGSDAVDLGDGCVWK